MSDELITISNYATSAEAAPAQATLEAQDIRAYVQGGTSADVMSYYGTAIGGVNLQVAREDVERALECLGISETGADDSPSEPWDCGECGARVDAGFEICWSCGASMDRVGASLTNADSNAIESAAPAPLTERCPMCGTAVGEETPRCPACGEGLNPAFDVLAAQSDRTNEFEPQFSAEQAAPDESDSEEEIPEHIREANQRLTHAFRSSVIGIGLCPPLLNIYSTLQLTEYHRLRREYELNSNWRASVTTSINWFVMLGVIAILLMIYWIEELEFMRDWLEPP